MKRVRIVAGVIAISLLVYGALCVADAYHRLGMIERLTDKGFVIVKFTPRSYFHAVARSAIAKMGHRTPGKPGLADLLSYDVTHIRSKNVTAPWKNWIEDIVALRSLKELGLSGAPIDDETMEHVGRLDKLRALHLYRTRITDAALDKLKVLPKLQTLGITNTEVTNKGLAKLKLFPKLSHLLIGSKNVSDDGLRHLKDIADLETLELGDMHHDKPTFSDAGLIHLAGLKRLTSLTLEGSRFTDKGVSDIVKLKNLTFLDVNDTAITSKGLPLLAQLSKLQTLWLPPTNRSAVSNEAIQSLQEKLPNTKINDRD